MKYITATFIFLVFNASWQWWVIMCAWMMVEIVLIVGKFLQEYKKQKSMLDATSKRPLNKEDLEAIWNNGFAVGVEHAQIRKH